MMTTHTYWHEAAAKAPAKVIPSAAKSEYVPEEHPAATGVLAMVGMPICLVGGVLTATFAVLTPIALCMGWL